MPCQALAVGLAEEMPPLAVPHERDRLQSRLHPTDLDQCAGPTVPDPGGAVAAGQTTDGSDVRPVTGQHRDAVEARPAGVLHRRSRPDRLCVADDGDAESAARSRGGRWLLTIVGQSGHAMNTLLTRLSQPLFIEGAFVQAEVLPPYTGAPPLDRSQNVELQPPTR